ncbi:MAG: hypothetical protein JNL73_01855 [Anaerolineales bacterium]|nr:hypothetical protein [Anaerolineales bacterium]
MRGHRTRGPAWLRVLTIALFVAAGIALLFQLFVYVHYAGALLRFPFDYDQGEGFELYDTVLHARGEWPYADSQVFPYYTSIYPPLFHLLTAPLVMIFGPQLWTGRLVSFLASLIAAIAIGVMVRRAAQPGSSGAGLLVASLSGLAFLASTYTFMIGPLFRQHMTMVMFECLGIAALGAFDWPGGKGWLGQPDDPARRDLRRLALGLAWLIAAGFSKQLALGTVAAALLYLVLRDPARGALAAVAAAAIAGGLFAWINLETEGWFYVSIIQANINAFDLPQMWGFYGEWLSLHAVLVAGAVLAVLGEGLRGRPSLYGLWFLAALATGALSGKYGAGESYFVTATAAACVLFGRGAAGLMTRGGSSAGWPARLTSAGVAALFLIQTALTFHTYTYGFPYAQVTAVLGIPDQPRGFYDRQGYTQLGPRPNAEDQVAGNEIVALIQAAEGPVFSEEAGFLFAAGKPIVTNPFPQLVMYQAGLFDPAAEIAQIERREFGLVVLRGFFYPKPVLDAIGENYVWQRSVVMNNFQYHIYAPGP